MHLSRLLSIAAFIGAIAAPLGASAATTYNFTIPLRQTGMQPGTYEFSCAVGSAPITPPTATPSGTAFAFAVNGTSFSGSVSAIASSDAPAHSYSCLMYYFVGAPPLLSFQVTPVRVTGTM